MKIKLFAAFLICFCVFQNGICQNPLVKQWDKRFGGTASDIFWTVQQTSDGGYILGGTSYSDSSGDKTQNTWWDSDYWIIKMDSLGNKQWDRDFGGTDSDELYSIQQTDDGGYILGGCSYSGIGGDKTQDNRDTILYTSDYWIVKIDSLGNKQWDKDFGGTEADQIFSVCQAADKGYILGGHSVSGISGDKTQASWGSSDYWIIKTDSVGNKEWDRDFGGTGYDGLYSIHQTTDRGFILGGFSGSDSSGDKTQNVWDTCTTCTRGDYWILKIDSLGNKQWDKDFGGTNIDVCISLNQTTDGGYILFGSSNSGLSGDVSQPNWGPYWSEDYWIVKIDSLGNKQWDKRFGGTLQDVPSGTIFQASDGGYLLGGGSDSPISGDKTEANLGFAQSWVVKIDSSGNKQWDKTVLTNGTDWVTQAIQSGERCYAIANYTSSGIGGYKTQPNWDTTNVHFDYWIIKFCDTALTTSSPTLALPGGEGVAIAPNPATDKIYISFPATASENITIKIFSITGEVVFEEKNIYPDLIGKSTAPITKFQIPVFNISNGVYFLSVLTEKEMVTRKLVVNH